MPSNNSKKRQEMFANPFASDSRSSLARQQHLDNFLNDGYEEVSNHDGDDVKTGAARIDRYAPRGEDDYEEEEEDYEYGNGRGRRDRQPIPEYPFQSTPNSANMAFWLGIVVFLIFFTMAYYGLAKTRAYNEDLRERRHKPHENDDARGNSDILGSAAPPDANSGPSVVDEETLNLDEGPEAASNVVSGDPSTTVPQRDIPQTFDPFNLHNNQNQQLTNHLNDWFGAPFIVSPPHLPIINDNSIFPQSNTDDTNKNNAKSHSRLGYFQFPTIFNGTLVFSSEGDLYLTRLPDEVIAGDAIPSEVMPAMKLTTTIGNAIHPKLNPKYPHLLVYSATYTGVREVYMMDLLPVSVSNSQNIVTGAPGTPGGPALRMTYTPGGILSVVGWDEGGKSILYSAMSMDVNSLPDVRLFRLWLSSRKVESVEDGQGSEAKVGNTTFGRVSPRNNSTEKQLPEKQSGSDNSMNKKPGSSKQNQVNHTDESATKIDGKDDRELKRQERLKRHLTKLSSMSEQARRNSIGSTTSSIRPTIESVPLAQATEGVYHTIQSSTSPIECIYFTRYKQPSSTKRYVGGTAENIWAYCPNEFDDLAIPLTSDYNGTSKSPSIYKYNDEHGVLLFMSDRSALDGGKNKKDNHAEWTVSTMNLWAMELPVSSSETVSRTVQLTDVACKNNGIDLSEYSVDLVTGGIILRVGADLHHISGKEMKKRLSSLFGPIKSTTQTPTKLSDGSLSLPIGVYSDFSNMQERTIPLLGEHLTSLDAFETSFGGTSILLTARGQTYVAPVLPDIKNTPQTTYGGGGRNMPSRRYKVAPGAGGGGMVRIFCARHVPQPAQMMEPIETGERLALLLATDSLSPTGEHAFYLIRTDHMASPAFSFASLFTHGNIVKDTGLPSPFLGGHLETGGSTKQGGLGSVYPESVTVSPCGRRAVWTDTDGRIVVLTIPTNIEASDASIEVVVLPSVNESNQPMVGGDEAKFSWAPGSRYLAIQHIARNQFSVISICDLGPPEHGNVQLGRIVQATPDRFNSFSPVWGRASKDFIVATANNILNPDSPSEKSATALFFLSDRDVKLSEPSGPWGTRSPQPSFDGYSSVFVLPLLSFEDSVEVSLVNAFVTAAYGGGAASEVSMMKIKELELILEAMKSGATVATDEDVSSSDNETVSVDTVDGSDTITSADPFVSDTPISFGKEGDEEYSFARRAYRISIPSAKYSRILCQLSDDPSLVVIKEDSTGSHLQVFLTDDYPSDAVEEIALPVQTTEVPSLEYASTSTDTNMMLIMLDGKLKIIPRTVAGIEAFVKDVDISKNIAHMGGLHLSVWPSLEYQQMYKDAWRMLRDYFYDAEMTSLPWDAIFDRYFPLVERCSKREELDDVLRQMAGELSALHVFVHGGEYSQPNQGNTLLQGIHDIASLGAVLQRSVAKNGYEVVMVPERDPDFQMIDGGVPMYSPLSGKTLELSGQEGLKHGDVIIGVNGEHVMNVPDIHMLLQNKAGESVRLEVVRYNSTSCIREVRKMKQRILSGQPERNVSENDDYLESIEPLIVVPMSHEDSRSLFYGAWEYKTGQRARQLAADAGFSVGYIHVQDMSGASAEDAFVRGYYPTFDKQALIIDVRNNKGGNIDSWILDVLQRRAWMYWESRTSDETTLWNSRFAFRGHLVALINEHTSSDGEAFVRGISELGLGKLVGKRTWGGGIWLSSDNLLVDGGIASAPEIGVFNEKLGWGMGIEQMGVVPDFEVDNNPRSAYLGEDSQLQQAIVVLKDWLDQEPVTFPQPGQKRSMSMAADSCAEDND